MPTFDEGDGAGNPFESVRLPGEADHTTAPPADRPSAITEPPTTNPFSDVSLPNASPPDRPAPVPRPGPAATATMYSTRDNPFAAVEVPASPTSRQAATRDTFQTTVMVMAPDGREIDLRLTLDPSASADALYDAVESAVPAVRAPFTLTLARGQRLIGTQDSVAALALRLGDRFIVSNGRRPEHGSGPALEIRAVTGPHAGSTWTVAQGRAASIGSATAGVDVSLNRDRLVAPSHARLAHQAGTVVLTDLGSGRPTMVDGVDVAGQSQVGLGSTITFGATAFALSWSQPEDHLGHLRYDEGAVSFNRPPGADLSVSIEREFTLRRPPETPAKRRFPLPAAILPVIAGLLIYFATTPHNPLFLSFAALGPAMAVWSWFDDRRSGRTGFRESSAGYRSEVEAVRADIAAAVAHSEHVRRDRWVGPDVVAFQCATYSPRLWLRRPRNPEFADLRLGLADQPSGVTAIVTEGGDEQLRGAALEAASQAGIDHQVPVVVPLRRAGVFGVSGPEMALEGTTRWLVLQLAAAHSPREMAIVMLDPDAAVQRWSWARWLPHLGTLVPDRITIATDDDDARRLFDLLVELVDRRLLAAEESIGASNTFIPHVVAVVRPPLRLPVREMTTFLERAPQAGVSVVWLDDDRNRLPGECRADLAVGSDGSGSVIDLEANTRTSIAQVESMSGDLATDIARALAPLRDISSGSANGGLPASTSLVELLDLEPLSASRLITAWRQPPDSLEVIIGAGQDGPVALDIVGDGPHGLAAGTTGSGKSAFLRTLVSSLAVRCSPRHLNFFFVDYAAAPAFEICNRLPHSAGLVSNLDAGETRRALVSLEAELERRQGLLLAAGAEDIGILWQTVPDAAFPRLLIVIDEFRALKETVPAFVAGVVDIAARGRKAGMHLILATQRPDGVITPDIEANTNFRVAFRTANEAESQSVLGRPDAFLISQLTRGRGFLKIGQRVVEFQGANVDGVTRPEIAANMPPVSGTAVRPLQPETSGTTNDPPSGPSDLERLVGAAIEASSTLGVAPPHRPWLPRLPTTLHLDAAESHSAPQPSLLPAAIGLLDLPRQQAQRTCWLDLGESGSLMILGGPRSGKTTALRTIAAAHALRYSSLDLNIYAIDYGSPGLAPLSALPQTGGVVAGTDIDRIRRLIGMLEGIVDDRRRAFQRSGATTTFEHRRVTEQALPEILFLLDGFGSFYQVFEALDRGVHLEALQRVIVDGPPLGIRSVITADRYSAIPPRLSHTIPGRLVMRMSSDDEYAMLGLPQLAQSDPLPAGRAFAADGSEIQIAVLGTGDEPDGANQNQTVLELAQRLAANDGPKPPAVELLAGEVPLERVEPPDPSTLVVPIGLREPNLDSATVDLDGDPNFLVIGPALSGKSTALQTIAAQCLRSRPTARRIRLSGRRTMPSTGLFDQEATASAVAEVAAQLATDAEARAAGGWQDPIVVMVDDGDEFMDGAVSNYLEVIQRRSRDAGIVLIVAVSTFKATGYAPWLRAMRANGHGLLLQPDLEADGDLFNLKLPQRKGAPMPPGRGFIVSRREVTLAQVAL